MFSFFDREKEEFAMKIANEKQILYIQTIYNYGIIIKILNLLKRRNIMKF